MLPAWKISTTPDAHLVNSMLDDAIRTLNDNEHPIVYTDQGCHYGRAGYPEWKKPVFTDLCQRRNVHRITRLVKAFSAD